MEAGEFKRSYFPYRARYLNSVRRVDTSKNGTFITTSHAKMIPKVFAPNILYGLSLRGVFHF